MAAADLDRIRANTVLARLSTDELCSLASHLRVERVEARQPAYAPGQSITHVYFPLTAVYSIVAVTDDRRITVEVVRLAVGPFREALREHGNLHPLLNRFTQATMVQISQNVICNRSHPIGKRMARWLLTTQDRIGRNDFPLSQEFLGQMLGVYRPTVADEVRHLQNRDVIRYGGRRMYIVDRARLERETCECYRIVEHEFDGMQDVRLTG